MKRFRIGGFLRHLLTTSG